MALSPRAAAVLLLSTAAWFSTSAACQAQAVLSIRRVQVLDTRKQVEIEIETSDRIVPQTNVLTGPDRLVVDFVNAVPGAQLRNQAVNRGEVRSLRVGLFSSNPPVTRVVLDLNGPQSYQVFPSGRTVIVKVGGNAGTETAGSSSASGPVLVNTSYRSREVKVSAPAPAAAKPALEVSFQGGLLSISSNKASLSEVLSAVQARTGAEIAIPAGAEQEKVVADIGPAPAREALAQLLNGSQFNFLILGSSTDPSALNRVILSSRPDTPMPALRPMEQPVAENDPEAEVDTQPSSAPPIGAGRHVAIAYPPPDGTPSAAPDTAVPETRNPPNTDVPQQ
jgi:hypothetical protein